MSPKSRQTSEIDLEKVDNRDGGEASFSGGEEIFEFDLEEGEESVGSREEISEINLKKVYPWKEKKWKDRMHKGKSRMMRWSHNMFWCSRFYFDEY